MYILELKSDMLISEGETFEVGRLGSITNWAVALARPGIQTTGPILNSSSGAESVGAAFKYGAIWAVIQNGVLTDIGTSSTVPASTNDPFSAIGRGSKIGATDGTTLFTFSGNSGSTFTALEVTQQLALPTPFVSVSQLIGVTGGVAGSGVGKGLNRSFSATPTAFNPWAAQATELFGPPVAGRGVLYFSRQYGSFSVVCRSTQVVGSFVCAQANLQDQTSGIALGASDTLYTVVTRAPANNSLLQVRTASTLALRYETPLPGVTGACLSLTPTCIDGQPVVGCVDTVGRIVFIFTDARGIETNADWPMEGHDPAKTFNVSTDLTPYACP